MAAGPLTARAATGADEGTTCGICQTAVRSGEVVGGCPSCDALFHVECWDENGGCAVYGCALAPESIHEQLEGAPGAVWGAEEKPCPVCARTIKAAALRCRHCGAMLRGREGGAAPRRSAGPGRAAAIALLVAGVVPCTSPVVLLFGGPWLLLRRASVRRWPASTRATAVMAVVAAGAVTLVAAAAIVIQTRLGARGAP
jgi:hypothetical protein